MKKIISTAIALSMAVVAFAQKNDGTTKSLINAEKNFEVAMQKKGEQAAYNEFALPSTLVFRPNPLTVKNFYSGGQNKSTNKIKHEAVLAKVSRSGDLGFVTGYTETEGENKKYGQYLSIWLADDITWKLALNINTNSIKPLSVSKQNFVEPKDRYSPQFINAKEKAAGKDIIITTEKTLNTMLKTHGIAAFSGFMTKDVRLMFPGNEAIVGSDKVIPFLSSMVDKINLKTTSVDKALGSDLAYTFGIATIDYKADLRESFNYVFVYEKAEDDTWNIIVQAFIPADR